jgi:DNA-binding transcriptional LysR family regulator
MAARDCAGPLTVAFDAWVPQARWGPLFHVFRLEHPGVRLEWKRTGFPRRDRPLLDGAKVGLFLEPPRQNGLVALTLDTSPMVVIVATGDRLADHEELRVADILDRPFPASPSADPRWMSFWTLDERRGGPPRLTGDDVGSAEADLEVVAAGSAIATLPASLASGIAHPGVIALALRDGPRVRTRLVWRSEPYDPLVADLADLAAAWARRVPASRQQYGQ